MKTGFLVLVLMVFAAADGFSVVAEKKSEFGGGVGCALPLSPSGFADSHGKGFNITFFGRRFISKKIAVGLLDDYVQIGGKTAPDFICNSLLAQVKMRLGKSSLRPYALAGIGVCFRSIGGNPQGNSNPIFQPGFGLEIGSRTKFFLESRLSVVVTAKETSLFMPVNIGLTY